MPQLERFRPENEVRMRVKLLDSAGRTREQVEAMEKNAYRAPKIAAEDQVFAEFIAAEQQEYPKVMYKLAMRGGKPAGDEVSPSYPLPFDLAQMVGIPEGTFKVIGKTPTSGGYLVVRHPYRTKSVGVIRSDQSIDDRASAKLEKEMLADGWVHSIAEIKGLPKPLVDDEYDPVEDIPAGK